MPGHAMHLCIDKGLVQEGASKKVSAKDCDVIHVEADMAEERCEALSPPEVASAEVHADPVEDPVLTHNPIFVQNLWEVPPSTGGFFLSDIIEERTSDLVHSGFVMGPSGKMGKSRAIASSTLESLPRSVGEREALSPSKKLQVPSTEQVPQHTVSHTGHSSMPSSLHQSLHSCTEHSLHDSLSDG